MKIDALMLMLASTAPAIAAPASIQPTKEQWQRAAQFDRVDPTSLVRNARIEPRWIDDHRFWYLADGRGGSRPMLVDARASSQVLLYDHAVMANALRRAGVEDGAVAASRPITVSVKDDYLEAIFAGGITCRLDRIACSRGDGILEIERSIPGLRSGDGRRWLLVRDHDLWLAGGANGTERRLTTDGASLAGYGEAPDLQTLHRTSSQPGEAADPLNTHWSPGGRWIITRRIDERAVKSYPFVTQAPADGSFRPQVREVRVALLGDPDQPVVADWIIDTRDGSRQRLVLPDGFDLIDAASGNMPLGWSADGDTAYLYATSPDAHAARIIAVQMGDGKSRTLIEERSEKGRVNPGPGGLRRVSLIVGGQLVFWSERDGSGQLYLYDLTTGQLIRQLTRGPGPVSDIFPLPDRTDAVVMLRASNDAGDDPYQLRPYRLDLTTGRETLLGEVPSHYELPPGAISPGGRFAVASHSTVRQRPSHVLYDLRSGASILSLGQADVSDLTNAGWQPPVRVRVKAADDRTDIYAVYFKPRQSVPGAAAPVVEVNYSNVIRSLVPISFMDSVRFTAYEAGLTELGFAVVAIDGRGTPNRSRAFYEAGYPHFADIQIQDHVAALKQIAKIYGAIDLCRVGVWGSSNGGGGAARAMLLRPDIYSVGVAAAGSHDYSSLSSGGIPFFGVPTYADGGARRTRENEVAANYVAHDNARLAGRLQGKLLLAYGELDDYAFVAPTARLARAFIDAGKEFDLLAMPGRDHFFRRDPYFRQRLRSYFVEHLGSQGRECVTDDLNQESIRRNE